MLISRVIKRIFEIKFEKYIHDVLVMFGFEFQLLRRQKREDVTNLFVIILFIIYKIFSKSSIFELP